MKKRYWWQSWTRFFLWVHVIGVVSFYLRLLQRTTPKEKDRVKHLPFRDITAAVEPTASSMVSIIVPARNEEHNIQRCVQSLLEQDYDHYEIIVVDDDSADNTGPIVRELADNHPHGYRLKLLHLNGLPVGWAGKPHALSNGIEEAQGAWLLLTDADTWHAPNALSSCIRQAQEEEADLLTLWLTQELPTFWDRVMMPMAYLGISAQYPPGLVNDPTSSVAMANGPYILLRHKVYDLLGGYGRPDLRETLLDDRDLARIIKEQGFRLRFMDGRGLIHIRMYRSLNDIWRGWRKNAYLGSRGGLSAVLLQLVGLPLISIMPFLLPLLLKLMRTKRTISVSKTEGNVATALELLALLVYRNSLNRHLMVPWYYSFTHPLAGALFEGILAQSVWRIVMRKGVDWRGRQYHDGKHSGDLQQTQEMETLLSQPHEGPSQTPFPELIDRQLQTPLIASANALM